MGKQGDPNAVLDSRLRVRGVRNLRVADVSSVPKVNNGHTQMVARNSFLKLTADVEGMKV
jgi:choline dehydrogenase-like flavoprotein